MSESLSTAATDQADAKQADAQGVASANAAPANAPKASAAASTLCPYCGLVNAPGPKCGGCGGLFEPLSLRATQIAMGPWQIRDKQHPFRPGCSYETLKKLVAAGRLTANSVVRGPTTFQFWQVARNTPGVAHLLGLCHACNASVPVHAESCPSCHTAIVQPAERNQLGLQYPTEAEATAAQKRLDAEIALAVPAPVTHGSGDLASGSGASGVAGGAANAAADQPNHASNAASAATETGDAWAHAHTALENNPSGDVGLGQDQSDMLAGLMAEQVLPDNIASHDPSQAAEVNAFALAAMAFEANGGMQANPSQRIEPVPTPAPFNQPAPTQWTQSNLPQDGGRGSSTTTILVVVNFVLIAITLVLGVVWYMNKG